MTPVTILGEDTGPLAKKEGGPRKEAATQMELLVGYLRHERTCKRFAITSVSSDAVSSTNTNACSGFDSNERLCRSVRSRELLGKAK